jgi:hypothetical protein
VNLFYGLLSTYPNLEWIALSLEIADVAARLRAMHGLRTPDVQRRFRLMRNVEELERALDYAWDKWSVFLHPAQRQLVERDYNGPARVSGSAGTGKTTSLCTAPPVSPAAIRTRASSSPRFPSLWRARSMRNCDVCSVMNPGSANASKCDPLRPSPAGCTGGASAIRPPSLHPARSSAKRSRTLRARFPTTSSRPAS